MGSRSSSAEQRRTNCRCMEKCFSRAASALHAVVKAVLSREIIELFFLLLVRLFLAVLFLLPPGRWAGAKCRPPAALQRKKRCARQCYVGAASPSCAATGQAALRRAVVPCRLFSRQVSVCLVSVFFLLKNGCWAPEGCACASASAATKYHSTCNGFLTKALLVWSQEDGKFEVWRSICGSLQNPVILSWVKRMGLMVPVLYHPCYHQLGV